jgi:hypothetical protein
MPFQKYAPPLVTLLGNFKLNTLDINLTPVTPSDATDLPNGTTLGLLCTAPGNVNVNLFGGGTAVLTGLVAGQFLLINATRVLATSTTGSVSAAYN